MLDAVRRQAAVAAALALTAGVCGVVILPHAAAWLPAPVSLLRSTPLGRSYGRATVDVVVHAPMKRTGQDWRLLHHYSAHYVLIVKIETDRIEDARAIATELLDPVKAAYAEAIVYFYRPPTYGQLASARVQWSRAGGYQVMVYEATNDE
jgi:hypothetical protein